MKFIFSISLLLTCAAFSLVNAQTSAPMSPSPMATAATIVPTLTGKIITPVPTTSVKAETTATLATLPEVEVYGQLASLSDKTLSDAELENVKNTADLSAALDHLSGLETQGEGFGKTWSALAIRGQSFRDTLVLVNGVRVPESFNLGDIPTDSIEKVEVLEGPQALVYGSDAIGGVVNIVTKTDEPMPTSLSTSQGDFNTYQFRASTGSFDVGSVHNVLSGSWYTTDGYLATATAADTSGTTVTLGFTDEVHWDINHTASWKIDGDQYSLSSGFFRHIGSAPDSDNVIAAGTDQYDLDGRQDAWGAQSVLNITHPLGSGWTLSPTLYGNYSSVIRSNPIGADPTSGVYYPYLNQYLNYGAQAYLSGDAGGLFKKVNIGIEARNESLWSGLYGDVSREVGSFLLDATLGLADNLRLDLANHVDYYTDFGWSDNPTGALVLDVDKDWQWHLSAGKGYKVPTFDELYLPYTDFADLPPDLLAQFQNSPFASTWNGVKGNPNLAPEDAINSELGTDIHLGDLLVQLNGFANYYNDLINPAVDPSDNFWTYVNIDHALFIGTENSLRLKLTDWLTPSTTVTWLSATDQNGNDIQGRLHFKWTLGAEIKPEKQWSLELTGRYVEQYPVIAQYLTDFQQTNGIPVSPGNYWDTSIDAKFTVSPHLKGFLSVENVLNQTMASLQGISLPGRYEEAGLQADF